jgi:hypothetical protein
MNYAKNGSKYNGLRETTNSWQGWQDSNPRHTVLETVALPTELHPYIC